MFFCAAERLEYFCVDALLRQAKQILLGATRDKSMCVCVLRRMGFAMGRVLQKVSMSFDPSIMVRRLL